MENNREPIGVVLSIQPKWSELILSGKKRAELRKTFPLPRRLAPPFRCFIYETAGATDALFCDEDGHTIFKGRRAVVGEFICGGADSIYEAAQGLTVVSRSVYDPQLARDALVDYCLTECEAINYLRGKTGYGWRVEKETEYKTPFPIETLGLKRPPQSWGYVYFTQPFPSTGSDAGGDAAQDVFRPAT